MKLTIEEGGFSQVTFKQYPTSDEQNFNIRMPLDVTFKVAMDDAGYAYQTAF